MMTRIRVYSWRGNINVPRAKAWIQSPTNTLRNMAQTRAPGESATIYYRLNTKYMYIIVLCTAVCSHCLLQGLTTLIKMSSAAQRIVHC